MPAPSLQPGLLALARTISDGCTQCRACQYRCAFLNEHGSPKELADRLLETGRGRALAFECSLCGLCTTICPMRLPLTEFFLAMRRAAVDAGRVGMTPYRGLLNYEAVGASRLFRLVHLPAGGDTVFFPGCTFPGRHPATARALLAHLRRSVPGLGVATGCCFKPSHDLGRQEFFLRRFGELRRELLDRGVGTVLTACPNCHKVFKEYGDGLAVRTVFETLSKFPVSGRPKAHGTGIVHTPCPYREEEGIQELVRRLAEDAGLELEKTRQDGSASPCCGEGGAVGALRPELAGGWTAKTAEKGAGRLVVTTCAGCVNFLSARTRATHLLDLTFFPREAASGTLHRPKGMAAYFHRLLFKFRARFELD